MMNTGQVTVIGSSRLGLKRARLLQSFFSRNFHKIVANFLATSALIPLKNLRSLDEYCRFRWKHNTFKWKIRKNCRRRLICPHSCHTRQKKKDQHRTPLSVSNHCRIQYGTQHACTISASRLLFHRNCTNCNRHQLIDHSHKSPQLIQLLFTLVVERRPVCERWSFEELSCKLLDRLRGPGSERALAMEVWSASVR